MSDSGTPDVEATNVGSATRATVDVGRPGEVDGERLNLLIIGERLIVTKPLPAAGDVRIGRSSDCEVVIDDPSVSRRHAVLSLGPPLTLRDLGSANGTQKGERPLAEGEVVELSPGDIFRLGDTTVIVQRQSSGLRAQRIWAHDYFEARLEEECSRSDRSGAGFAVARFHCQPAPQTEIVHEVLARCARTSDVVGEYSPNEIELLLVDTAPEDAKQATDRLIAELSARELEVKAGLACCPADGRSSHELLQRASPLSRPSELAGESANDAIVADQRMHDLYRLAERIAAGHIPVLILGETGAGKEILGERIHRFSPRAEKAYLRLNCAALSETLLESELFGHEKGAFTGAVSAKPGLLESANGGSVFLDEIGELPYSLQVKLLRVLEEGSVLRVGGLKPRSLDVRFIAATNRDLEREVERGTFRQDLFFRLNGATLVIPPLRERKAEIPALVQAFAEQAARQVGQSTAPAISEAALQILTTYGWPGNIRELRNTIERAVLLCGPGPIRPSHLPLEKMQSPHAPSPAGEPPRDHAPGPSNNSEQPPRDHAPGPSQSEQPPRSAVASTSRASTVTSAAPASGREDGIPTPSAEDNTQVNVRRDGDELSDPGAERERILEALSACMGNQTAAAKRLGIARRTLIKRMERYGISGPRKQR